MPLAKLDHTQDPGSGLAGYRFCPNRGVGRFLKLGPFHHSPSPVILPECGLGQHICGREQFQFLLGAGWSCPFLGWGSQCGRKLCLRPQLGPLSSPTGGEVGDQRKGLGAPDMDARWHVPWAPAWEDWFQLSHVPVTQHLLCAERCGRRSGAAVNAADKILRQHLLMWGMGGKRGHSLHRAIKPRYPACSWLLLGPLFSHLTSFPQPPEKSPQASLVSTPLSLFLCPSHTGLLDMFSVLLLSLCIFLFTLPGMLFPLDICVACAFISFRSLLKTPSPGGLPCLVEMATPPSSFTIHMLFPHFIFPLGPNLT